jgi:hypothetical protein
MEEPLAASAQTVPSNWGAIGSTAPVEAEKATRLNRVYVTVREEFVTVRNAPPANMVSATWATA